MPPQTHNKAWVALVMAALGILEQVFGYTLGVSEQWVTMVLFILSPLLVWLVPNHRAIP